MKLKEYALYRGEEILSIGTINEIAEKNNIKPETLRFYKSPSYKNRGTDESSRMILICLDDD